MNKKNNDGRTINSDSAYCVKLNKSTTKVHAGDNNHNMTGYSDYKLVLMLT